jgi:hypothetical protein
MCAKEFLKPISIMLLVFGFMSFFFLKKGNKIDQEYERGENVKGERLRLSIFINFNVTGERLKNVRVSNTFIM